jgi:lipopolysaccharide exporter
LRLGNLKSSRMRFQRAKSLLGKVIKPGESLSSRVVVGGFWVLVLRVFSQVLSLGRIVVLARLLSPNDFGLMGITMLVMAVLDTFSQTGFQIALIQKKERIEEYLDTAWTTMALRGFLLYGLLFVAAPFAATFYEAPEAGPIIQVAGLMMIINALASIRVVYFKKELEFQKQFMYMLSGTFVDLVVSVTLALIFRDIWALVYGLLAGGIARLVVSYIIAPYFPKLRIDVPKLRELYSYGRWIFGSSIFIFLLTQGDDALLGKVLGLTALGFYQMAHRISNLPATEISHVISSITLPAYSKLQDNKDGLREAYLRVLKLTALLSIPAAGGIFILAPELTRILLGERWLPMVSAMQVLVIGGATRSIGATMGPVFQAVGKPQILTKFLFVQTVLVAILIYPLTVRLDIMGTALSLMIPGLIVNSIFATHIVRITGCGWNRFFQAVGYPLLGTLAMVFVIFVLKTFALPSVGLPGFILLIVLGVLVYLSVAYIMERFFDYRLFSVFRSIRTSFLRAS